MLWALEEEGLRAAGVSKRWSSSESERERAARLGLGSAIVGSESFLVVLWVLDGGGAQWQCSMVCCSMKLRTRVHAVCLTCLLTAGLPVLGVFVCKALAPLPDAKRPTRQPNLPSLFRQRDASKLHFSASCPVHAAASTHRLTRSLCAIIHPN